MLNSLRGRLTLVIIGVAVVPLMVVGIILTLRARDTQRAAAADVQQEIAQRLAHEFETFITDRPRELQLISEVRGLQGLPLEEQRLILAELLAFDESFEELVLLDVEGREILRESKREVVAETTLGDRSDQAEFLVPAEQRTVYYSPVKIEEETAELLMTISIPLVDLRTGELANVLVGEFRLKAITTLLQAQDFIDAQDAYLVSASGAATEGAAEAEERVVAHGNPSIVRRNTTFGTHDLGTVATGLQGDEVVVGLARFTVGADEFTVVTEITTQEAYREANQTMLTILVVLGGVLVLAGVGGYYFARRIARPVVELADVAERIGGGELALEVAVGGSREVIALSSALNLSLGRLRNIINTLEERVAARTRDLFLTLEVGQLSSRIYHQAELLPRVADFIRERFDLYYTQIYLVDDAGRFAYLKAGTGEVGRQLLARKHRLDLSETSIVAQAYQTQRPVLVADTLVSDVHLPNPLLPETRSEVAIPLVVGEQILGVLDMQARKADTFREDNLPVFEAMANQLASVLRGAQAYTETQVAVERADEINRRLTGEAWAGYLRRLGQDRRLGFRYDLQTVEPLSESLASPASGSDGRLVCQPVLLRDEPIGTIQIVEHEERDWSSDDLMLIEAVADRVALALEQFRAFDATQSALSETAEQAQRLALLNELAAEISAAEALDDVYRIVAARTDEVLGSDRASIAMLMANGERFEMYGLDSVQGSIPLGARLPRAGTWVGEVLRGRRARALSDMSQVPYPEAQQLAKQGLHSSLNAPLIVRGQAIGTLNVARTEVGAYDRRDEDLLTQIASLLSAQIENRGLLEQAQRRASEMQTVAEVGAEASGTLDPDRLLWTVVDLARERFDLYHAHVYLLDDDGQSLRLAAGAGDVGQAMVSAGHRIAMGQERSLVARVARTRVGVIVNDVTQAENFLPNPMLPDTRAEIAVPMLVGDRVIGVLDVQASEVGRFTEADLHVQGTLASQIAIAVQNARSFADAQRSAAEMQTVAEVGAEAAASLDPLELLKAVSELTKERFGLYHTHAYLIDDEGRNMVLHAGAGEVGDLMARGGHRIPLTQHQSLVVQAVLTRQPVVVNNVADTPDYFPNPMLPLTRSELATPMIAGGEVIGVLDVQADRVNYFTDDDVRVQLTLASQIAVAVQNARLFAEQVAVADQLREVDQLKSEFLASMSHELRTPLNSIIGYAEVLLDGIDGELTGDMEEDVGAIHGSGKHLLNLINDILDLAKIEAGQMDLVVEDFDLLPVAEDVASTNRILLKGKPVDLVLDIPEDLPMICADSLRIRQVVSNLFTNAIKFTEEGSITLWARPFERDPQMVEIAVIDTGIGLSSQQMRVIFDRFRQVDQSHTRRAGGTGLGLSITRQLVEMHGGEIWVESEPGVGSTFAFTLPFAQAETVDG